MNYTSYYFASTYGSGTYDNTTYNGSTSSSTGTTGSGLLTNTGFDIALGLTIACVIIFTALVVKFWRRGNKKSESLTN